MNLITRVNDNRSVTIWDRDQMIDVFTGTEIIQVPKQIFQGTPAQLQAQQDAQVTTQADGLLLLQTANSAVKQPTVDEITATDAGVSNINP